MSAFLTPGTKQTVCNNEVSILTGGTQRQFSENICSEDDLRSRIFRALFVVKFLACLPLLGFSNIYNCPFLRDSYPEKVT